MCRPGSEDPNRRERKFLIIKINCMLVSQLYVYMDVGGVLLHAGGVLLHAGGALLHAGGVLLHAGGVLSHSGEAWIYAR